MRKYIKRVAGKAGGAVKRAVKKRYVTKTGKGLRVNQIVKDVAYLKSVLNPEKKKFSLTATDATVGQCFHNVNGFLVRDVTPVPAQGTTSITRNGNSIRVHSAHMKFQFQHQNSTTSSPIRFRIMFIKVLGVPQSASNVPGQMYNLNQFVLSSGSPAIIDYNSDRKEETFKRFRIIASKNVYLRANQHSGQATLQTGSIGIKFKSHHVKFRADGSQDFEDGQIVMLVLADNGNTDPLNISSLTGTMNNGINTGALFNYDLNFWFYDN